MFLAQNQFKIFALLIGVLSFTAVHTFSYEADARPKKVKKKTAVKQVKNEKDDPNALLAETLNPAGAEDGSGSSLRAGQSTGEDTFIWLKVSVVDIEREVYPGVQFLARFRPQVNQSQLDQSKDRSEKPPEVLVEIQTKGEDAWYLLPGDIIFVEVDKKDLEPKPSERVLAMAKSKKDEQNLTEIEEKPPVIRARQIRLKEPSENIQK